MALRRHTKQRNAILEVLRELKTHPTAAELYGLLRRGLPRISLGTVYRNLEALTQAGLIRKLVSGHEQARFDGDLSPHHHVRCVECGRVADVYDVVANDVPTGEVGRLTAFQVLGHRLEFFGICPECRARPLPPGTEAGRPRASKETPSGPEGPKASGA